MSSGETSDILSRRSRRLRIAGTQRRAATSEDSRSFSWFGGSGGSGGGGRGQRTANIWLVALLVGTVVLGGLAWSAVRTPSARSEFVSTSEYSYRLAADYRATAPASPAYPSGAVSTVADSSGARIASGPLYAKLVDSIHLEVTVDIQTSGPPESVAGVYDAKVEVRTPEGWSQVVDAGGARPAGNHLAVPLDIPLAPLRQRVAEIGALTGVGGKSFSIMVTSSLTFEKGKKATPVKFVQLPIEFQVDDEIIKAEPVAAITGDGRIGATKTEPNDLHVLGAPVRVDTARIIFPGLAMVMLAATLLSAGAAFAGIGMTEARRVAARYRTRIVEVSEWPEVQGEVIQLGSIADLARLARAEEAMILHEALTNGSDRYRVVIGAQTYQYETSAPASNGADPNRADAASRRQA